jgi:hypothetical protein
MSEFLKAPQISVMLGWGASLCNTGLFTDPQPDSARIDVVHYFNGVHLRINAIVRIIDWQLPTKIWLKMKSIEARQESRTYTCIGCHKVCRPQNYLYQSARWIRRMRSGMPSVGTTLATSVNDISNSESNITYSLLSQRQGLRSAPHTQGKIRS